MSKITREQVQHVAKLARLKLTEAEVQYYTNNLNTMFLFMDKLNEVDTSDVVPTSHVLGNTNVMRADQVRPSLPIEEVLQNAPAAQDGQFKVPAVLGE